MNARVLTSTFACPDCDLLQRIPPLPPGGRAACARCGHILARQPSGTADWPLVLTLTALIAFAVANTLPLLSMSAVGRSASTTIIGGAYQMWMQGMPGIGVLVAFCAVLAPGSYLLLLLVVLLAARRAPAPPWVGELMRWVHHLQVWAMLEVMMLGILVALIKIAELATVEAGIAMFAFGSLVLLFPAIQQKFNARDIWRRIEWADGEMPSAAQALGITERAR